MTAPRRMPARELVWHAFSELHPATPAALRVLDQELGPTPPQGNPADRLALADELAHTLTPPTPTPRADAVRARLAAPRPRDDVPDVMPPPTPPPLVVPPASPA